MLFSDLDLIDPILKSVEKKGYKNPTPIQEQSIPPILDGRDVLWSAQTGTGKTASFAIPTLQILAREKELWNTSRAIKSLVLTPTRELAIQIQESFNDYGSNLPLKHTVIFGGVGQGKQVQQLKSGVDILVATPGRLLDLMNQGFVDLRQVEIFILDEADRMLNMWFINDVRKVLAKLPVKKQTLFFSATMPKEIAWLADSILDNPVKIVVAPVSSTADTVKQAVFYVSKQDKKLLLIDLLNKTDMGSVLVFSRTKHGADKIVRDLDKAKISAQAIHGNKSQNNRQRALSNFKSGETRVLVATDIAARGIDVDSLAYVINYDLPNEPETYVHRIGRTGRAGKGGMAISFCNEEEFAYLLDIQKLIGREIEVVEKNPYAIKISGPMPKAKQKQRSGRPSRRPSGHRGASSNNRNRR